MEPIKFHPADGKEPVGWLEELNKKGPLHSKLRLVHAAMRRRFDFVDRVAVALYDPYSSNLKTFISSYDKESPLPRYEFPLNQALSLLEAIVKGPRVVNDLSVFSGGLHNHTKKIEEEGFKASYTIPILFDEVFWGFIFINSYQKNCFTDDILRELDVYCHVISSTVVQGISDIRILKNALKTTAELMRSRNPQTGTDTRRVSRISRWIVEELAAAGKCSFDEEAIERLHQFSALHDVGMMAIPDSILLKPERLDRKEFAIMTSHTERGLEMIDTIITNFSLQSMAGIEMLRNIVLYHHEKIDGRGYPHRLKGKQIPIEARIVAVADVYDAMTSERPWREAFSSQEAFDQVQDMKTLDRDCVAALLRCRTKVESDS